MPRLLFFLPLILACRPTGSVGESGAPTPDSGEPADSGTSDGADGGSPDDFDGDGFLSWQVAPDPSLADCDDQDPAVTPATEILVPAGASTRGRDDRSPDQAPARSIHLSAYCMDRTEVSNTAFLHFLEAERAAGRDNVDTEGRPLFDLLDDDDSVPERLAQAEDGSWSIAEGYADHPVTEVYHWSGVAYCASRGQRLPTEAEWEKAARGDDDRRYPWGDAALSCDLANMRPGREGAGGPAPCVDDTTPVGSYPDGAGPHGHLDLAGNVAEWVWDWYQADYYAESPDQDPRGPDSGFAPSVPGGEDARITRGGAFPSGDVFQEVSHRTIEPGDGSSNGVGFRCVRPLEEEEWTR